MWLKIDGKNKIDSISSYTLDYKNDKCCIWFEGCSTKKEYVLTTIDIGPKKEIKMKENEILIGNKKILNNIKEYTLIGDNDIRIGNYVYKTKNIKKLDNRNQVKL